MRRIDKTGESDVTYDCYYNVAWQLLEVRKGGVAYPYEQYVWSARYVDAPVLRWRDTDTDNDVDETLYYATDANRNVAAVTDAAGAVQERYVYDPYGKVTCLDLNWANGQSASRSSRRRGPSRKAWRPSSRAAPGDTSTRRGRWRFPLGPEATGRPRGPPGGCQRCNDQRDSRPKPNRAFQTEPTACGG